MNAESLRASILQEAIQGRLVPQLESEPEVEQIGEAPEDVPFEIPEKWKWCNFGDVVAYGKCEQVQPQNIEKSAWILDLEDIKSGTGNLLQKKKGISAQSNKSRFRKGDVLYSKLRPYLNKVIVADDDGYCTTEIVPISPSVAQAPLDAQYLKIYLMSPYFVGYANQCSYGVKMPRLGTKDAQKALFPLPPLKEQYRIVAKLNELLPLVETYGKEQEALEKLEKEFPDKLRASLLQEAIQGKLVPQLESEPEVRQLGEVPENVPFAIPEKWKWVKLENLGKWKSGGTPSRSHREYYENGTIPWLKTGDLNDGVIKSVGEYITNSGLENSSAHINPAGSVLIAMYGATIGKVGILQFPCATNQACCACVLKENICDQWYLFYFLLSQRKNFIALGAGGAQPNISRTKIVNSWIPLPPLEEQHRIVAKLNELIGSISQLAQTISTP